MAKTHEKTSTSLIIREVKIKLQLDITSHTSQEFTNNECWRGAWRKGNALALLMGM